MDSILVFFRDYGGLVNAALLVSILGVGLVLLRHVLEGRKAQPGAGRADAPTLPPGDGASAAVPKPQSAWKAAHVCGTYAVVGTNPGAPESMKYAGELRIEESGAALVARWTIGPQKQQHEGWGILVGSTMSFAFQYAHPEAGVCVGIVVYQIVSQDTIRGVWTGFGGNEVAYEEGRRQKAEGAAPFGQPKVWGTG